MESFKKKILPISIAAVALILICLTVFGIFKYSEVARLCDSIAAGEEIDTDIGNAVSAPIWTTKLAVMMQLTGPRIPLVEACRYGNIQAVRVLLENGADPDLYIEGGWSALEAASIPRGFDETSFEIIKLLIESGADPNCNGSYGPISMQLARHFSTGSDDPLQFEAIIYLLEHGGIAYWENTHGDPESALFYMLRGGHPEYARELLDRGYSDIGEKGFDNKSALIYVAQHTKNEVKAIECAELLLSRGADVTALDKDGMSAYDYASERGYYKLAEMLRGE